MLRGLIAIAAVLAALFLTSPESASLATPKLPNLQPLPPSELRVETGSGGLRNLRFTVTSWNSGDGPVELIAGEVVTSQGQQVYQRVYNNDNTYADYAAGYMDWHPAHNHFHFNDYALYTIRPVGGGPLYQRTGSKVTFCVMDTQVVQSSLPGAPTRAVYSTCGVDKQGMSVGWADTYGYWLEGQSLDIRGFPDGEYRLTVEIDPRNRLREKNDRDNIASVVFRLRGNTVTVRANQEICDGLDNDSNGQVDEGFPDTDGDGLADCVDPDADNDGYSNEQEIAITRNPIEYCGIMRADVNQDGQVTTADLSLAASRFLQSGASVARLDQNFDGIINVTDLSAIANQYLKSVSSCP